MIRSRLQRFPLHQFMLAGALFGAATSSTALADLTDAVATHTTVTATDFGGVEVTVHVVDLYLLADDEADRLLNVYNFSIACGAPFYQSFGAPGWCVQGKGPFNDCTPADSFITIGGIGSHDLLPRQCDFDRSCSCTEPVCKRYASSGGIPSAKGILGGSSTLGNQVRSHCIW